MWNDLTFNRTRRAIRIMCHGNSSPCEKLIVIDGNIRITYLCGLAKEQGKKHAQFGIVKEMIE